MIGKGREGRTRRREKIEKTGVRKGRMEESKEVGEVTAQGGTNERRKRWRDGMMRDTWMRGTGGWERLRREMWWWRPLLVTPCYPLVAVRCAPGHVMENFISTMLV